MEDENTTSILTTFFDDRLLPLAGIAQEPGRRLFPRGPDRAAASYYNDRHDDGNYIHEIDTDDLAGELHRLWLGGDMPELAEIADEIVELADQLRDRVDTPDEVSPFVYAMF